MRAGDVKEFGFRSIPEDGNYTSHFSGDTSTPKADAGDLDQTSFSDSRPTDSESDLIDLGQDSPKEGSAQGSAGVNRGTVEKAISDADSATKEQHPYLHQRHQQQQQQQQQGEQSWLRHAVSIRQLQDGLLLLREILCYHVLMQLDMS